MNDTHELMLPEGEFGAYLFDLDGTVADSMPLHYVAWVAALREFGATFAEDLFYAWGGIPPARIVEMLNERQGLTMNASEVVERKEQMYLDRLVEVKPVVSVLAHIEAQRGRIPFAIVSGSPRLSVVRTIENLGLLDYFPVVVAAEDYGRGKPDAEPFLTAAARLGVAPERCLVFEDAEAGIASAVAAGMQYVRVPVRA